AHRCRRPTRPFAASSPSTRRVRSDLPHALLFLRFLYPISPGQHRVVESCRPRPRRRRSCLTRTVPQPHAHCLPASGTPSACLWPRVALSFARPAPSALGRHVPHPRVASPVVTNPRQKYRISVKRNEPVYTSCF